MFASGIHTKGDFLRMVRALIQQFYSKRTAFDYFGFTFLQEVFHLAMPVCRHKRLSITV